MATPMDARAVAARLGVKRSTVYEWVRQRKLRAHRLGGRIRFDPEDVEAFWERGCIEEASSGAA